MTDELKEKIMELACDLCVFPFNFRDQAMLDKVCEHCPLARLLDEMSE